MGLEPTPGAEAMAKCPHHDDLQADVREVRTDVREVNRKLDALAMHLIPQARNGTTGAVTISAGNTTNTAAPAESPTPWLRIITLCLVILVAAMESAPRVIDLLSQLR